MSVAKIILLLVYVILAALALGLGGGGAGEPALNVIFIVAAVHLVEVAVFYRFCREAGGSLPVHLVSVFIFGVVHVRDVKAGQSVA